MNQNFMDRLDKVEKQIKLLKIFLIIISFFLFLVSILLSVDLKGERFEEIFSNAKIMAAIVLGIATSFIFFFFLVNSILGISRKVVTTRDP